MSEEKKETHLLSPEEIEKRRAIRQPRTTVMRDHSEEIPEIIEKKREDEKYFLNTAGAVKINFETLGRFDIPRTLHFNDYSGQHVLDITMSNDENFVENLLTIMQELMVENDKYNVGDMLPQEFLEAMVGIKIKFNTPHHEHRWICDCQLQDDNKEAQIYKIDLRELNYTSILESDEKIREYYKPFFDECSNEEFLQFLELKYGDEEEVINWQDYDREEELKKMKVKEPMSQKIGEDIFKFRFTRMKDIITAQKIIDKKYAVDIKKIEMKKTHGVKKAELELNKEKEMSEIQTSKMKDLIHTTKALTLIKYNGKDIETNEEKIELYKKIKRKEMLEFTQLLQYLNFGIQDERDFECSFCGKPERRLLQREFDPYEFIPMDTGSGNTFRESSKRTIFLGI